MSNFGVAVVTDFHEQQFGPAWVDVDVAQFVAVEQVEPAVAGPDPGRSPFIGGLNQLGAGVAQEDDGFAGLQGPAARWPIVPAAVSEQSAASFRTSK